MSRVALSNAAWIVLVGVMVAILAGLVGLAAAGMLEPNSIHVQARRLADALLPAVGTLPSVLAAEKERTLKPGDRFQECWCCPEMVVVPAGEFMMGSTLGRADEQPVHKVSIATPLAVGRFEVTFDEWDGCIVHGGCPARNMVGAKFGRGRQPVINVSWDDAQTYVNWLSKRTGKTYRLLTEAEWEYAARAANTSEYSFGDSEAVLSQHAWFKDNSHSQPHAVGGKKPNGFSLYDMHGNVWEWVEDCYVSTYAGAPTDGSARSSSPCDFRVLRGGTWNSVPEELRSANRDWIGPADRGDFFGFRVMRVLPSKPQPAEVTR